MKVKNMKFDEFWIKVQSTKSKIELTTLVRGKPFSFSYQKYNDTVVFTPSYKTKDPRSTNKKDLKEIWGLAKTVTTPFIALNYHKMTFNSSYVVSLMKHILNDEKIE